MVIHFWQCIIAVYKSTKLFPVFEFELDHPGSDPDKLSTTNCRVMGTFVYLVCIAVASFIILAQPAVARGASTTLPLTYPGRVLQGVDNQTCPSVEHLEMAKNEIKTAARSLLRDSIVPDLQSYTFVCGGSTGWKRVVYLNMSDSSQQCPSVWQEITTPHRVCGRRSTSASCEGLTYSTGSEQYDQVCGRIIGYQIGSPDTFAFIGQSVDGHYMDGISVTHGPPRQHIWSFVAGLDEDSSVHSAASCPCVTGSTSETRIPSFVRQNYFCEAGITQWNDTHVFFPNGDPLWDGQGCGPTSSCCTFNSPPWFNVQLFSPTTDDIEVRICGDYGIANEDTPIQLIELYVK